MRRTDRMETPILKGLEESECRSPAMVVRDSASQRETKVEGGAGAPSHARPYSVQVRAPGDVQPFSRRIASFAAIALAEDGALLDQRLQMAEDCRAVEVEPELRQVS